MRDEIASWREELLKRGQHSALHGGEYVGLVEIDDREWDVYFGPVRLGRFHEDTLRIEDALGRQHRRPY